MNLCHIYIWAGCDGIICDDYYWFKKCLSESLHAVFVATASISLLFRDANRSKSCGQPSGHVKSPLGIWRSVHCNGGLSLDVFLIEICLVWQLMIVRTHNRAEQRPASWLLFFFLASLVLNFENPSSRFRACRTPFDLVPHRVALVRESIDLHLRNAVQR